MSIKLGRPNKNYEPISNRNDCHEMISDLHHSTCFADDK